jgi:peptidoglycan/LPS O-acetylase OafA/YrhL
MAILAYHALLVALVLTPPRLGFAPFGPVANRLLRDLPLGLALFFCLSGYLICRPFAYWLVAGAKRPPLGRYFKNRALRILPAFWIIYTVVLVWKGPGAGGFKGALATYGLLQSFLPTTASYLVAQAWTVGVEAMFYVLIPVIFLGLWSLTRPVRTRSQGGLPAVVTGLVLLAGLGALSLAVRSGLPNNGWHLLNPLSALYNFVPGIALAVVEPVLAPAIAAARRRGFGRVLQWLLLLGGLISWGYYSYRWTGGAVSLLAYVQGSRALAETLGAGGLVGALLVRQWRLGDAPTWLDNRPLRFLGQRSYSIYLIHGTVLSEMIGWVRPGDSPDAIIWPIILVGAVVSIALGAVSYRLIEVPFLRRRSSLTRPRDWASFSARRSKSSSAAVSNPPATSL